MLSRGYDLLKEHLFHTKDFNTTWHLLNIEHTPTLFMVNKIQNHCSVNPFGHVYSRKSNTTRLHVITDNKLQIICPCLSRLLILHAHNFTIHYLEMPCEMLTSYISHRTVIRGSISLLFYVMCIYRNVVAIYLVTKIADLIRFSCTVAGTIVYRNMYVV